MSYKTTILRLTPPFLHRFIRDAYWMVRMSPNYVYDFWRYLVHAGMNTSRGVRAERAARITLIYHQVEKGLSLADPRFGFGMKVIPKLLGDIDAYLGHFGIEEPAKTAMAALNAYVEFHERQGQEAAYVKVQLEAIKRKHGISDAVLRAWVGGTLHITRAGLVAARNQGFSSFFESRHSVRQFSGGVVPRENVRRAVALAQKTPSVCNRQAWKAHLYDEPSMITRLLEIQAGSRGFGEKASLVFVVTCELGCFVNAAERYQAWIDGGMFSMSLCLALHDQGYGTCCLNWSKEWADDKALRAAAGIPASEQIIMLVAVGTLPEAFEVARSARPPVDQCLVIH
jgi:nitroreductase